MKDLTTAMLIDMKQHNSALLEILLSEMKYQFEAVKLATPPTESSSPENGSDDESTTELKRLRYNNKTLQAENSSLRRRLMTIDYIRPTETN
jgi:hypothetical protein